MIVTTTPRRLGPLPIAIIVIGLGAVVRLTLAAWLPLFPDETYYWEWSRHLAPGYFDHPPGIALAIRAGTAVAGISPLGVRLGPWLAGTLAVIAAVWLGHSLGGPRAAMWTAIITACLPAAALGLVLATPDAILVAAMAVTLVCVLRAVAHPPGSGAATTAWLSGGAALGVALISKYPGVLIGAGVLLAVAAHPQLRAHFRRPAPYAAAVLALAISAPMVWWNAGHDWVSFRFQLHHGLATSRAGGVVGASLATGLQHELSYVGGIAVLASPLLLGLIVGAIAMAVRPTAPPPAAVLAVVALTWLAAFGASALRHSVEMNWAAPGLLATAPLVGWAVARGWARGWAAPACGLGFFMLAVTIALAANPSAIAPLTYDPIARAVGWETLGARVAAVRAADAADLPPGHRVWVAANRYQDASELAFHIPGHPTVFALNIESRANEYDLWPSFVASARPGDDLVLVVDDDSAGVRLVDRVGSQFARRAGGERIALQRRDAPTAPVARRQIWLLRDWSAH